MSDLIKIIIILTATDYSNFHITYSRLSDKTVCLSLTLESLAEINGNQKLTDENKIGGVVPYTVGCDDSGCNPVFTALGVVWSIVVAAPLFAGQLASLPAMVVKRYSNRKLY